MINMIYLAVYFLILASYGIGMSKSNRDVYGYGKIVRDGTNSSKGKSAHEEVVAIAGKNLLKERLYERSKRTNVEAERRDQRALAREKKKEEQEQVAALNNVEAERRDQRALAREKKKEEQETLRRGGKDSENVEDFIDSMNGGGSLRGRFHLSGDGFEFDFRGAVVGDLFKYQVDGVKWLFKLHCQGHGGILADDMGLGKTRQVCVFLKGLFNTSSIERVLILAPPGLLGNWERELLLVDLKWQKYRKLTAGDKASKGISLVSMVLLEKPDNEFFQGDFPFCKVIIDEGHVLKNPETKKASNVLNIRVKDDGFIIMSGTPIQNNLMEFYELLNLCHQKHFGDLKWFSSHYEELIKYGVYRGLDQHVDTSVKERVEELKTRICSYYLRREKETTLALPPKHELVIWLKLSQKQRNMYLAFLKLRETNTDEFPNVFSACERLQSLCSDPTLWYIKKPLTSFEKSLNKILCEAEASSDRESESVKLVFLSELLPDIIKQKECVLIFSQYLGMLDAVELLVKPKYKFLRLDGNTDPKKRDEIIEEFQSGDFPIFLLSYKVGALGYNLTKATRVILLDLSWNPTTDDQAVDRAYRLKQTKSVLVYRLVCCGTIEERKYRNQILKNTLCRTIFGKKEPLRIFREKDIDKTFDVQEKDFNSSAIKRIIDTQLMKTGQHKMPSSLEQYVDSLMSKDYIHGVSSHSLIVSAVDRLKSRSRSRSKSPGHRLERPGLDDSVGRAQVASFDHRIPESCRSGTIPCEFFASGNCRNGKACRFSHDSDLNLPKGHEQRAMRSSVDASAPRYNRFKAHRMHILMKRPKKMEVMILG